MNNTIDVILLVIIFSIAWYKFEKMADDVKDMKRKIDNIYDKVSPQIDDDNDDE